MKKTVLVIMIFLLSGCSAETNDEPKKVEDASHNQETAQNEQTKEASNDEKLFQNDEEPQDTIALVDYTRFFPKKDATLHYVGEGSPYATYDVEYTWLAEDYVLETNDTVTNGGTLVETVYKIAPGGDIFVVFQTVDQAEPIPNFKDETLEIELLEHLLPATLEIGHTFDEKTIVDINETVVTPYKTFQDVIVVEEAIENENTVYKQYYSPLIGLIKGELISETEEGPFIVTSSLHSVTFK